MQSNIVTDIVRVIFSSLPYLLALALGMVVAVMGWRRSPKAGMMVAAGVVVAGLSWLWEQFAWRIVFAAVSPNPDTRMVLGSVLGFLANLGYGVSIVLLCVAAFVERPATNPAEHK